MRAVYDSCARKRPVNLTLNEDLVARTKRATDNLSGLVESLLADFLSREDERLIAETRAVEETVATWNRFARKHGSFADEHSTL